MASLWRLANGLQAGALLLAMPVAAQLKMGDTSVKANGTVSTGYTATYANDAASTHGWTLGGVGTFAGSYYSPNFLSFSVSPYLNQSRANSDFQSITDASGVNGSVTLFGGSGFPGSINYSDAYNSEGNYAIPGLANYVTHGNSQNFGVNWSENLANVPSFSAGYQLGSSSYSVYGTNDTGKNSFHSLNLHSGYRWEGFNLGAFYTNGGGQAEIPQIVAGQLTNTNNSSNGFGFNLNHALPLQGSASMSFNRSSWNTDYLGYNSNGTIDTTNTMATIHPGKNTSLTASLNYSDNLAGQLIQTIIGVGGVPSGLNSNESSNALDVMGIGTYTPIPNLQTQVFAERRAQSFLGSSYGVNSFGGGASYAHRLLGGNVSGSLTLSANSSDTANGDTIGISSNENYSADVHGWHVSESFGYAQNVQTLLVTYMNSYYNYSVNVRRNWGLFNAAVGAGGARTALTQQAGASSSSQSYNAGVGLGPYLTATGTYSKSDGQALLTSGGLVPVPVPSPTLPAGAVSLYGGDSYSMGLSSTPIKRLIMSATYGRSNSNTADQSFTSTNQNSQFNSLINYQFRKVYFTSGYSRLEQGFSAAGTKPEIVSSYYMGLSRWFNFF